MYNNYSKKETGPNDFFWILDLLLIKNVYS